MSHPDPSTPSALARRRRSAWAGIHVVAAHHRRPDRSRGHAVHPNTVASMVGRHRSGEGDHGTLRRGVGGQASRPEGADRGDVDDRSPTAVDHQRDRVLRHQHHRGDVHVHDPLPPLEGLGDHVTPAPDPHVVHEDVEAASTVATGGDHGRTVIGVGDIGLERAGRAAVGFDHRHRPLGQLHPPIDHDHVGPCLRQQDRSGPPVADAVGGGATAGHDRDPTGQVGGRPLMVGGRPRRHPPTTKRWWVPSDTVVSPEVTVVVNTSRLRSISVSS